MIPPLVRRWSSENARYIRRAPSERQLLLQNRPPFSLLRHVSMLDLAVRVCVWARQVFAVLRRLIIPLR